MKIQTYERYRDVGGVLLDSEQFERVKANGVEYAVMQEFLGRLKDLDVSPREIAKMSPNYPVAPVHITMAANLLPVAAMVYRVTKDARLPVSPGVGAETQGDYFKTVVDEAVLLKYGSRELMNTMQNR